MARRVFNRDYWMNEDLYSESLEHKRAIFDAGANICGAWWNMWTHNINTNAAANRIAPEKSIVTDYGTENGPVLIVGAGPSFLDNLDLIVHFSKAMPVIATDRVFKPLREAGANIFITVSADAQNETLAFFEGAEIRKEDRFALSVITSPLVWDCIEAKTEGVKFFGNINPFAPWWNLAAKQFGNHINTTSSGAVVTHSAVDIAYWMGFDAIFTVGNDLCYRTEADAKADTGGYEVIEIDGRPTIHCFERAARGFALYARLHPDCMFVDCSGGIERGWGKMNLKDAKMMQDPKAFYADLFKVAV